MGTIAYFSAEFGLAENLPIYSGGLGVLAGDHVKAASDLNLPLVAVGVLYRKGYFRQHISADGRQEAFYPELNPWELPVEEVRRPDGTPILVDVPVENRKVYIKLWRAQVGKVSVYLMDSDHDANSLEDRRLTDSLYGGDQGMRICQEIILGIGGVRVIRALGLGPHVWHINEGHAAMLTLERLRECVAAGIDFDTAVEAVKACTLFTTHTPVPAGHDIFSFDLVERYLGMFLNEFGAAKGRAMDLGRAGDRFNMTRLAVRMTAQVNGVSKLHAGVTKELFRTWMPHIPVSDIPVQSVTNGIHTPTWLAPEIAELFARHICEDWQDKLTDYGAWQAMYAVPDSELWGAHQRAKERMLQKLGLPQEGQVLTVGFARRFAAYKRSYLLFRDLARLSRLINHPERPVRLVFAGKAHPADWFGQDLIRRIVEVSGQPEFAVKIFFVEDYDIGIAQQLVQGVDLWLNTPLKPMEASGTSGQKAAVNGVLNCSVLDGWWNEGFNGQNGWAIYGTPAGEEQDRVDGDTLYWLLEEVISPLYYRRDAEGVPREWIGMMKESMATLVPFFNTKRMVEEYRDRFYVPLAQRCQYFGANNMAVAQRVAAYKRFIRENWEQVQVHSLKLGSEPEEGARRISSSIRLGPVWRNDVRVEVVGSDGNGGVWQIELSSLQETSPGEWLYEGLYHGERDAWYRANPNVRVIPISKDFSSDFEMELSRWGQVQWR